MNETIEHEQQQARYVAEQVMPPAEFRNMQIAEYSKTAQALTLLRQSYANVTFNVQDKMQMKAAKLARAELKSYRVALEAKRKEIKAEVLERGRLIDDEARKIREALEALEVPIDEQIKAEEQRLERIERERVDSIHALIEHFRVQPVQLLGKPSQVIASTLEDIRAATVTKEIYQEFAEAATLAREQCISALEMMVRSAREGEEAAARALKAEEENKRMREEQEQRDREARERIRAEEDRLAQQRREFEEQQAKARREQEERERQARLEQEEKERKAREQAEAERIERESREYAAKKAAMEVEDARGILASFAAVYGKHVEFAPIVKVIAAYFKKHPEKK